MWWFRKKNKKIPNSGLMLVVAKIETKIENLLSIKHHAIFSGDNNNLEKAISAIETQSYEELKKLDRIEWDSDFLSLITCEFADEKIIYIYRKPFEYLYDSSSFLYEKIITDSEYKSLCVKQVPFSNYIFKNGKLVSAFASDGENLFERYDFTKLV